MVTRACEKLHARGRVGFVFAEVEQDAEFGDVDEFEEVDGQGVGLRAVGLPVGVRGGGEEG